MNKKAQTVIVVGAGLCGSLLALRLAQRGYKVRLFEKRPDLRKADISVGRSINLAFSDRGIRALTLCGIANKAKALCIPMRGRMIHEKGKDAFLSPYSGRKDEHINSISRQGLNALLLDEAEKIPGVSIIFNQSCTDVDLDGGRVHFQDGETGAEIVERADVIFGADGAGSVLRKSMLRQRKFLFSYSQDFLGHGYKELSFPPGGNGTFATEKHALHIWPRGENMLIALPNIDGSFTVTLFLSFKDGADNFAGLTTPEKAKAYFQKEYPDALALMPDLGTDFFENPVGNLGTIKCSPWSAHSKTLIIGDAAHAVVPFYGQGMNASFEDVSVLDSLLDRYERGNGVDWGKVFTEYERQRKVDTDAIADLAVDNFHEMKAHTANPLFQQKRKLETAFEASFPDEYFSKYSMVTFRADLPYSEAMRRGRAQDKAILRLIASGAITEQQKLRKKLELVLKATEEILREEDLLS